MSDIPDKVIKNATNPGAWMVAADFACHNRHDGSTPCYDCWEDAEKIVRAAAPVIAEWARAEERERWERSAQAAYAAARFRYKATADTDTYEQGRMDALGELLDAAAGKDE